MVFAGAALRGKRGHLSLPPATKYPGIDELKESPLSGVG